MNELPDESTIVFSEGAWSHVREAHRLWWRGELGRPLIQMCLGGAEASRPEPALDGRRFTAFYDDSVPAAAIAQPA